MEIGFVDFPNQLLALVSSLVYSSLTTRKVVILRCGVDKDINWTVTVVEH